MAVPKYPYPVVGGLERQSHELSKTLIKLGINMQALSYQFDGAQPALEVVEGVPVYRIPWSSSKGIRFIRTPFALTRALWRLRASFDIVHLHQFSWFSLFVILVAKLLGKHVMLKLSNIGLLSLPGLSASRLGAMKLAIFRKADVIIAMCRQSLDELDQIRFPRGRILMTPNGIRVSESDTPEPESHAAPGTCHVVFVGRLSSEKRIDDLLHAWKKVVESTSRSVRLELWGDGPLESELKKLCSHLGIGDTVTFRGHVDSVRENLGKMDLFVLTSIYEGNSNAILEAMAAGLPVVGTRVGGTPMQVGPEGSAYLVNPGDAEGIGARLLGLIEDDALRQQLGRAMHQRIVDHFDIRHVAQTYASAYTLLAAGRRDAVSTVGDPVITE
ncbi:MAG: glycosyltransferase family 4 protein [Gammaproteobacteria bacterium]